MVIILALTVVVLTTWGFFLFNRNLILGIERPNTASWNLWVLFTLVNSSSYFSMNGDWIKLALPGIDFLLCVVTWLVILIWGHFSWPPKRDWVAIAITLGALFIWKFSSAIYANLFVQVALIVSFIPCVMDSWEGKIKTKPWIFWTLSHLLNLVLVGIRNGSWVDLFYPSVSVILHSLVVIFSWYSPKKEVFELA